MELSLLCWWLEQRQQNAEIAMPSEFDNIQAYECKASAGDIEAMVTLARMYMLDEAVLADVVKAVSWLEKAASLGDCRALFSLGYCHSRGLLGKADAMQAKDYYERAITAGHDNAIYNLGVMHDEGRFGERDVDAARDCYTRAAKKKHTTALYNLALMYSEGDFGPDGDVIARELYGEAVELGHVESMYNLALTYRFGVGGEPNSHQAKALFVKAAALGHERAACFLPNPMISAVLARLTAVNTLSGLVDCVEVALDKLEDVFFSLRQRHLVVNERQLAHFTTWNAIDKILPPGRSIDNKNCLRQYHVDYMNDPFEGQRLLTFLGKIAADGTRSNRGVATSRLLKVLFDEHYFHSFTTHGCTDDLLPSVFTVSLTAQSDRLDLWRAYGADGAGYAIVIPVDGILGDSVLLRRNRDTSLKFGNEISDDMDCAGKISSLPLLYWIRYSDEEVEAALRKLGVPLNELCALKNELAEPELWTSVASCATAILLELLYLFKDEQYSTEREARALSVMRLDNKKIKVDERTPGYLYCETAPFLFRSPGYEVILGPKVERPAAALWNIRHKLSCHGMAENAIVRKSRVPYR